MIRNEGAADRTIRLVVGAAALLLSSWVGVGSVGGILLLVVASVGLVSGAAGFCPTYLLLKISTNPTFHRTPRSVVKVAEHH